MLTLLPEALRSTGNWEPIITGAVIILIVMFLPHGILGSLLPRLRRPGRRGEPAAAGTLRGRRRRRGRAACRGGPMTALLETSGLTRRFGGVVAVTTWT